MSNKKIIIGIDGFSSCGKSTLAKQLAQLLNYVFIDTGAMYRAITLYFLQHQIDITDEAAIHAALQKITLHFKYNSEAGKSDMYLNGENVEAAIRTMEISNKVSDVAALEAVRVFAVAQQQQMGIEKGIVMDGRDIGTTVFPEAELKIFVTAKPEVRAQRRFLELQSTNPDITMEEVSANLQMRDQIDSTRAISPLRQAADAIVLDNSNLTREEQLELVLQWVKERTA